MKAISLFTLIILIAGVTTGCTMVVTSAPPTPTTKPSERVVALPPILPTSTPRPTPTDTPEPPPPPNDDAVPAALELEQATATLTPTVTSTRPYVVGARGAVPADPPTLTPTSTPAPPTATATPTRVPLQPTGGLLMPTATPLLPTPTPAAVAEVSPFAPVNASGPTASESTIPINTYAYASALTPTQSGDPVFPYPRLDHNRVGSPAPKSYKAIVLENRYTQLTILPELGGRIYRWIDKTSGQSLFYENPVIKPTQWGNRGWWLATGGMEWALPTDEHGLSEASAWNYGLFQTDDTAGVNLSDVEEQSGLLSEITVALDADHNYFTVTPRLVNPTDRPVSYKFWINSMLDLGAKDPQPGTSFVLPGGQVTVHSTADSSLPQAGEPMNWPVYEGRDLSRYSNWTNYLGVFAAPAAAEGFMGAYNRETNLGVVRVFPHTLARGAKIFGPGDLDSGLWTDDGSRYFELWGGLTPTFADETTLQPGAWVTWQEQWYAVGDMGGFSAANTEAALNLGLTPDSVQVAAAGTSPFNGNLVLWQNGQEATRWPVALAPERPFRGSFAAAQGSTGPWGATLFDSTGREVLKIGQTERSAQPQAVAAPAPNPATPTPAPQPTAAIPTSAPAASQPTAAVPTSTPAAPLPTSSPLATPIDPQGLTWDSRLSELEIDVTRAQADPGQPVFRLTEAKYQNEFEAGGRHHVFVEVLDEQGRRIVGQPVKLAWADGEAKMVTEDKPYPEYAANAPLYGSMEDGTYRVSVDGAASDEVTGLGLPAKHHVSYLLTFQRGAASGSPPPPPVVIAPTPTPTAAPVVVTKPSPSGQLVWDSRMDELGITMTSAQAQAGQPVFRLVEAKYENEFESKGMHHIFVEVLDEQGQRIVGQPVKLAWADGEAKMVTEDKPYPEYAANAPMYGMIGEGEYSVFVDGTPSDRIDGLGLPGKRHVNYLLTFQRKNQ